MIDRQIPVMGANHKEENGITSRVISAIRFPLAVMVVFIHSFGEPLTHATTEIDYTHFWGVSELYDILRVAISHVMTHCAVPTFFLISGYLFFTKLQQWNWVVWKRKMKKRIHTLFIPYIVWISISIALTPLSMIAGCIIKGHSWNNIIDWFDNNGWLHMFWDCHTWNLDRTNMLGCLSPSSAPYLIPFWFMRDLMVVVLLTPIIYYLIKRFGMCFIFLVTLFYVTGVDIPVSGFSILAILYFSFGAYIMLNNKDLVMIFKKYRYIAYRVSIVLLPIIIYYDGHNTKMGNIIYPFFIISMVVSVVNLTYSMVKKGCGNLLISLSSTTFFIFAAHSLLLPYVRIAVQKITNPLETYGCILAYFLIPIVTILICIFLFYVLKRYTPRLAKVIGCR